MKRCILLVALFGTLLSLAGLLACGGGGGGGGAAGGSSSIRLSLVYTDPPPAAGYRFVSDALLSTPTHLVLNLVGPDGGRGRGVAFALDLSSGSGAVAWAMVTPGDTQYVENILFNLGPGAPLVKTALQGQTTLLADIFQKGPGNDQALDTPICRVALDAQAPLTAGSIPISVVQFKVLPPTGTTLADATAICTVGTLAVQ